MAKVWSCHTCTQVLPIRLAMNLTTISGYFSPSLRPFLCQEWSSPRHQINPPTPPLPSPWPAATLGPPAQCVCGCVCGVGGCACGVGGCVCGVGGCVCGVGGCACVYGHI